jgi:hypothetical protein
MYVCTANSVHYSPDTLSRHAHRNQVVPVSLSNSHTTRLTHGFLSPTLYLFIFYLTPSRLLGVVWCGCAGWVRSIYGWWRLVNFAQRCEALVYALLYVFRVSTLVRRLLWVFLGHYGPMMQEYIKWIVMSLFCLLI